MSSRSVRKSLYNWIRDLHLYGGLFAAPFLFVFALSTVILNHRAEPEADVDTWTEQVRLDGGLEPRNQAKKLMRELGIAGDLRGVVNPPQEDRFTFFVARPRESFQVQVTPSAGTAEIRKRTLGVVGALIFMHTQPGRHRPRSMVEWTVGRIWNFLADTIVYLLLFLTVSGIYLWTALKAERRGGVLMIVLGGVSFLLILTGLLLV